ncbi:hypothetical protein V1511DRAFT_507100 [Dipodascopsis uninucleata]
MESNNFNMQAHPGSIDHLPREIQLRILRYLAPLTLVQCSNVSKQWHDLCFDGSLWRSFDTSTFYRRISSQELVKLIKLTSPFIKDLNLRGCSQLNSYDAMTISKSLKNLEYISLDGCRQFDQTALSRLLTENQNLIYSDFSSLSTFNNTGCLTMGMYCHNLQFLDLSWCCGMDATGLVHILRNCRQLNDLRIAGCRGVDNGSFMKELHDLNCLKRLSLASCSSLRDECIRIFVHGSTEPIRNDFATNRPRVKPKRLEYLNLSYCFALTSQSLIDLAYVMPNLREIELAGLPAITDDGFRHLLQSTPQLSFLDCEDCFEISDRTLEYICNFDCRRSFKHGQFSNCRNLTDEGAIKLIKECPLLQNLEIDNTRVSDKVLDYAVEITRDRVLGLFKKLVPLINRNLIAMPKQEDFSGVILRMTVYDCPEITWESVLNVMRRNSERIAIEIKKELNESKLNAESDSRKFKLNEMTVSKNGPQDEVDGTKELEISDEQVLFPSGFIELKCYFGWQRIVDHHMTRLLKGQFDHAVDLEQDWAEFMTDDPDYKLQEYAQKVLPTGIIIGNKNAAKAMDSEVLSEIGPNGAVGFLIGSILPARRPMSRVRRAALLEELSVSAGDDDNLFPQRLMSARGSSRSATRQSCSIM